MMKLRNRVVKTLVQGHIADKWQNQNCNLWKVGLLFKSTHLLTREGVYLPIPLVLGLAM